MDLDGFPDYGVLAPIRPAIGMLHKMVPCYGIDTDTQQFITVFTRAFPSCHPLQVFLRYAGLLGRVREGPCEVSPDVCAHPVAPYRILRFVHSPIICDVPPGCQLTHRRCVRPRRSQVRSIPVQSSQQMEACLNRRRRRWGWDSSVGRAYSRG